MKRLLFFTLLVCVQLPFAYADPCTNIQDISCGNDVQFNSAGLGDPTYPNGMNGQGCSAGQTNQGGQETIYRFVVRVTGTYQLNTTLSNGGIVDYYYKRNNTVCSNTGWTCIDRAGSVGAALGAFNWNEGDTILFLLNAEGTGTTTQSFKINCATNVCDAITAITCGNAVQFNALGYGDPSYPNGMNGQGCSANQTNQGGQETIYRFVVPATGTYQMSTTLSNGGIVDYYYKRNDNTCVNTGWTCIDRTGSAGAQLGAFNWNEGDIILFLLNAEGTGTATQSFMIKCATNICDVITPITCGNAVQFNALGYGDPSYPNGMNGQGCSANQTNQGGQETIYRFVVPATGTYQMSTTLSNGGIVDYYYKRNDNTCVNTGWTCIDRTGSAGAQLGAFNWNTGDIILFLMNAEGTGTTTQSFIINCATNICDVITPITCGNAVQFNALGYGDPSYPNGMNGQGCSANQTNQGGQETIYRFVVPATGTYQMSTTLSNGGIVDYYYKRNDNTCVNTGWTCIDRTGSAGAQLGAFNWNEGDIILFLANAEGTGTTAQSFMINCATNICDVITPITCGNAVQFNALGYGDPSYPNGMNGQGCSANQTNQGGQETIYRFVVPATGTYQMNTTLSNGGIVDYYYKVNNTACVNTGWTCIDRSGSANRPMGAFNWNEGDIILFLLNAEGTGTTTQSFMINCATNICDAITSISCGSAVQFNSFGYGDPSYPNGMNGQGCSANQTNQGGPETIYRFVVPATGTYQMNTTLSNGGIVDYYYKVNNTACINTGWTCIDRSGSADRPMGAFNWNAGDIVLFLLNAEGTETTTQSFMINCATNICTQIVTSISCGNPVQFNSFGYGDPSYPNGMNGQQCSAGQTNQGGPEAIYRFVITSSGNFPINTTLSNGGIVDYYYKLNSTACVNTGWTCIGRAGNAGTQLGTFAWNARDTILLLLNAEGTGTTTQSFRIDCTEGGALPVKLLSFDALNSGTVNKLSWTTAFEINTDYFIVEHSINGSDFNELTRINASINTSINKSYQFVHHFNTTGLNYYRLKMVDADGRFTYSKIVAVNNKLESAIQVFPIPAKDILKVRIVYNKAQDITIQVADLQGRILQQQNRHLINGISDFNLDISSLAGGVYVLVLNGENTKKLFVKE